MRLRLICASLACLALPAQADEAVIAAAQELLNRLGLAAGPADGVAGPRTLAAMETYLARSGLVFDGEISDADLALLTDAQTAERPTLRFPGRLVDLTHARADACGGRVMPIPAARTNPAAFPPLSAFDDGRSDEASAQRDQATAWAVTLATHASLAASGDAPDSATLARELLLTWAEADAGLGTAESAAWPAASGATFNPAAPAARQNLETAVQVGYSALYAMVLLGPVLSDEDRGHIAPWVDALLDRYGTALVSAQAEGAETGLWRGLNGRVPMAAKAVVDGDEAAFQTHVLAAYGVIRRQVDDEGAILRNANRGDRALHWQSLGLLGIASLIALVEGQGGTVPPDVESAYLRAARFFVLADRDAALIRPYAAEGYTAAGDGSALSRFYRESPDHQWWMIHLISRYPDSPESAALRDFLLAYGHSGLDRHPLESSLVPYAANCVMAYDLRPVASGPLAVETVTAEIYWDQPRLYQFAVDLTGATLGGASLRVPTFDIHADFSADGYAEAALDSLRLAVRLGDLEAGAEIAPGIAECGDAVIAGADDTRQVFLSFPGTDTQTLCVLDRMGEADAALWSAVLSDLGGVTAAALAAASEDTGRTGTGAEDGDGDRAEESEGGDLARLARLLATAG